jgi:hypothetical protein
MSILYARKDMSPKSLKAAAFITQHGYANFTEIEIMMIGITGS